MAKMMLHDAAARAALGRGVAQLARAVRGTLGPRGMNAVIDRPIGTPIVSRDGVSIAQEIELDDPFENMGAQIVREVSRQTNEVAGDGTTTATILADALVAEGLASLESGTSPVELADGLEQAAAIAIETLAAAARPLAGAAEARAVASIAAGDAVTGALVAEALERVGPSGVVTVELGATVATTLDVLDGMTFDRGYISHHMVTDLERMEAVLDAPLILLTDQKLATEAELAAIERALGDATRPLLIIAEEIAPACVIALLRWREQGRKVVAINPPDYGHWRKAMLEDLGIVTGGRVIARELGGTIAAVTRQDLGQARQVRVGAGRTVISGGGGDATAVAARREQVARLLEAAPPNVERDKLQERLARLSGGTAVILAGGATPVEQKRRAQLIEDAVAATRAAREEGVVPGGGAALLHAASALEGIAGRLAGGGRDGARLLQRAMAEPARAIAVNCGLDPDRIAAQMTAEGPGIGLDARTGRITDLARAGIVDPVRVSIAALRNAVSVAVLILTTQTLIATRPEHFDPTAGPALGGGAERLGRS